MSPVLAVETADFVDAARTMTDQTAMPMQRTVGSALATVAELCGGMAGDDPAGLHWAAQYDAAAEPAARAAQDAINACLRLSALFAATARNYERADSASDVRVRRAIASEVALLPEDCDVTIPTVFDSAAGGEIALPVGWPLVAHLVRYVWPNGHQDRLRAVATAWRRSAAALDDGSFDALLASIDALRDSVPEGDDVHAVCSAVARQLTDLARTHRGLAEACEQLAHHIDVAHSKVERALVEFGVTSLFIEGLGQGFAFLTAGAGEAPVQAAEASRIAAAAAAIDAALSEFVLAAGQLAASLPSLTGVVWAVRNGLADILSLRVVTAEVEGVPGLRAIEIVRMTRTGREGENAAAATASGTELTELAERVSRTAQLRAAAEGAPPGAWARPSTVVRHFLKHGTDFNCATPLEYQQKATEFLKTAVDRKFPTKIDEDDGTIRIWDPSTNTFGSYAPNGATRTFFKPTSSAYWSRQPGVSPW